MKTVITTITTTIVNNGNYMRLYRLLLSSIAILSVFGSGTDPILLLIFLFLLLFLFLSERRSQWCSQTSDSGGAQLPPFHLSTSFLTPSPFIFPSLRFPTFPLPFPLLGRRALRFNPVIPGSTVSSPISGS